MVATALKTHVVAPEERSSAKGVLTLLAEAGGGGIGQVKLVFEPTLGRKSAVVVSEGLVDVIRELAGLIEKSRRVSLFADDPEVTPEQASNLLGISRPTVVQRIKQGDLSARMVGAHHRIRMSDLIAFRRQDMEKTEVEFETRSNAARFAAANTVIEGGHVLPETEELMNEWARGEIDDELIEHGLKRFGTGA